MMFFSYCYNIQDTIRDYLFNFAYFLYLNKHIVGSPYAVSAHEFSCLVYKFDYGSATTSDRSTMHPKFDPTRGSNS